MPAQRPKQASRLKQAVRFALRAGASAALVAAALAPKAALASYAYVTGNPNYSLEGAQYKIYKDDGTASGKYVQTLTTNASGDVLGVQLEPGSYKVKETKASPGYLIDSVSHPFTITAGQTNDFTVYEVPVDDPIGILIEKVANGYGSAAENETNFAPGDVKLSGAGVEVKFYAVDNTLSVDQVKNRTADATAIWETDDSGELQFQTTSPVSGSWPYHPNALPSYNTMPLGIYSVREAYPPAGLQPNSDTTYWFKVYQTSNGGPANVTAIGDHDSYLTVGHHATTGYALSDEITYNPPIKIVKADARSGALFPEGDGAFGGCVVTVANASASAVRVGGATYEPGAVCYEATIPAGATTVTIPAGTLPYGTYVLCEKTPPTGYRANASWRVTIPPSAFAGGAGAGTVTLDATYAGGDATLWEEPIAGGLRIQKFDRETGGTEPQGGGSFARIRFAVTNRSAAAVTCYGGPKAESGWASYEPGEVCLYAYTNDSGLAETAADALPYGRYEVREDSDPLGYRRDGSFVRTFSVRTDGAYASFVTARPNASGADEDALGGGSWDSAAVSAASSYGVDDQVVRGGLAVTKRDADSGVASPQGDARLRGATYYVYNMGEHPVRVRRGLVARSGGATPSVGEPFDDSELAFDEAYHTYAPGALVTRITTNDLGFAATGKRQLPYGPYLVVEIANPKGYSLDDAWRAEATVDEWDSLEHVTAKDVVARGGVRVQKADGEAAQAQGDATLSGCVVQVVNDSRAPVTVDGTEYEIGDVVLELVTDENGVAASAADALPYGTYVATEKAAPAGYKLNASWRQRFHIRSAGQVVQLTDGATRLEDEVVRGGVRVRKLDAETRGAAIAGLTLAGATIEVVNASAHPVRVGGRDVAVGQAALTLVTGEDGSAESETDALPYGTYRAREVASPEGYHVNTSWQPTFQVRADGEVAALEGDAALLDQAYREDIHLTKKDADTMREMAGVAFVVTSRETGESHVIVTDDNGIADTTASYRSHEARTNANDPLVTQAADGTFYVTDDAALDASAGTWFAGAIDGGGEPTDALRALPYGHYVVAEARCAANAGKRLVAFEVTLDRDPEPDGITLDLGTIDNETVRIRTSAAHAGTRSLPASRDASVTDTVSYMNLEAGRRYRLEAELRLLEADGSAGEVVATGGRELVPEASYGSCEVELVADARALAGRSLVVFERLYEGERLLAEHADATDEAQTLHVPKIGTTLTADGAKEACADAPVALVDEVAFENCVPGVAYELSATLARADGSEVRGADGAAVSGRAGFVATSASGTASVTLLAPASIAGGSVVCLETLLVAGEAHAEHKDLSDAAQTVSAPALSTAIASAATGSRAAAAGAQRLDDAVSAWGLVPGAAYEVEGELARAVRDASGAFVALGERTGSAATATLVAGEDGRGEATLAFSLDAEPGQAYVALVTLKRGGRALASDVSGESDAETVICPALATSAADGASGLSEGLAREGASVSDTVRMRGLVAGVAYELRGELHRASADGRDLGAIAGAAATLEFTAASASESRALELPLDASALAGERVVCFERLYAGGALVGEHADATDASQTVSFPKIATTLQEAGSGAKAVCAGPAELEDTVRYEGLEPGGAYELSATLVDAEAPDVALAEGSLELVPEGATGEAAVALSLDASQRVGARLVCLERLWRDGALVAEHADLNDEAQTVRVVGIATTLTREATGRHEAPAADGVTLVDSVRYEGLEPGAAYELVANLVTREPGGKVAQTSIAASAELVPERPSGVAEVRIECDLSELSGKALVCFEELRRDGELVAEHADPDDEAQTVRVPGIATTLVGTTAAQQLTWGADGRAVLHDHVTCDGLEAGATYRLRARLVTAGEGGEAEETGIEAQAELAAEGAHELAVVEFSLTDEQAAALAGRKVVCFEELSRDGETLAEHADITDARQSAWVAAIATTLAGADGAKEVKEGERELVDTVAYRGLIEGGTYALSATLVDAESGEEVGIGGAAALTAAEGGAGEVKVPLPLGEGALARLAGRRLVCFETLTVLGEVAARHADLADAAQTVTVAPAPAPTEPEEPEPTEPTEEPEALRPRVVRAPAQAVPGEQAAEQAQQRLVRQAAASAEPAAQDVEEETLAEPSETAKEQTWLKTGAENGALYALVGAVLLSVAGAIFAWDRGAPDTPETRERLRPRHPVRHWLGRMRR